MKLPVMSGIHDCLGIDLPGEQRTGLEDFTGFCGFGRSDWTRITGRLVRPLAPIQVEANEIMSEV